MNLKRLTVKGIGWATSSQVLRLVITFVVTAILARLLEPDDFGLVAMVTVFTNFAAILNDIGLPAALVQRKELTDEQQSSSFWVNLLEGLLITLLLIALAPLIAKFYSKSQLMPLVMVLSSNFFISSFGMIQAGLLAREMNFGKIAFIEIASTLISGIAAVVMAYTGFGVWSLAFQNVITSLLMAIMFFFFCDWKPGFVCRWSTIKELFWFGINLTGFNVVNYFSRNFDNLLIGRFLGSISLGFYSLAYRIFLFPLQMVSGVVGRVMFPALSSIQEDKERVRETYITATRIIALVTFPVAVGLLIMAPQFVRVVFGEKWARVIPLMQILAMVGLIQSIATTVGWVFLSQGRTNTMLKWSLFATSVTILAFLVGLKWDIEGVATAYAIANVILIYPAFCVALRLIDLRVFHYFRRLAAIAGSVSVMAAVAFPLRILLERGLGWGDLAVLLTASATGVFVYVTSVLILDRAVVLATLDALKTLRRK